MNEVTYIEVTIGKLPEWYHDGANEGEEYDYPIERAIEVLWKSNPAFENAEVNVTWSYSGVHTVEAYDDDGDKVFERECDLDAVFEKVYQEEVQPYLEV